ncbi:dipeptidyl-peptidase-4 [Microbispora rosea]|uniref:Dipeptidyl-peptidase-4 n=1 Tax=Microbispora rosea TaxID=58117 RepID=A0A1N6WAJ0_9ACTN|nr:DPP IV N-terminal domain-containing protein [Microbispora rosea]GIH49147.1 peptidase [Microbispora rosea subsp. rosea]SIQ87114.1 dipeptidyl-peptidase-4 [Microbispora rosea]
MTESFPRLHARTRRFTLGVPRNFTISPDGGRVTFLRTRSGTDPVTCLWELDVASGAERLVVDPLALGAADEDLPPEERARRERSRESAGGVVAYATDREVRRAVFALSGDLYLTDLASGGARRLPAAGPVIDPRLDPTGARVAYVTGGALHVLEIDTEADAGADSGAGTSLAEPEGDLVTYGLAEFIAAEEMGRMRGYWWSPSGDRLLVARVDESPVTLWHIADPANPDRQPVPQRYPAAGTANAEVTLHVIGLDGARTAVPFEQEYLVTAAWDAHGLAIVTLSRDQRTMRLLSADPDTGETTLLREDTDPAWVDIVAGVPARLSDGRLVWVADADGGHRLVVGDEPVTPPSLQVRAVLDVDGDTVLFQASGEPSEVHLWTYTAGTISAVTTEPGVHSGRRAGGVTLVARQSLDTEGTTVTVGSASINSLAERPGLEPRVSLVRAGSRELSTAILLPSWHVPGSGPLPVLMDPYGGPHAQRVLSARRMFLESQWWAEQGFAVIVADGRGTPGRGPAFEREMLHDFTISLQDQVDALQGAAALHPGDLDLSRVAIRGWSFGGYLAALAVLRRPDVFHAAVAGAPVTDWRLYDTCYTERYLGHPDEGHYERSSLLGDAEKGERPLLLIHGLADDNVVAAHTLRLSSALLAAGRPHTVLPLSGVTHMTPQEVVAENLLLLQLDFLRKSLNITG